jgi:hypothetical protein
MKLLDNFIQRTFKKSHSSCSTASFYVGNKVCCYDYTTAKKSHVNRKLYQTAKRECITWRSSWKEIKQVQICIPSGHYKAICLEIIKTNCPQCRALMRITFQHKFNKHHIHKTIKLIILTQAARSCQASACVRASVPQCSRLECTVIYGCAESAMPRGR